MHATSSYFKNAKYCTCIGSTATVPVAAARRGDGRRLASLSGPSSARARSCRVRRFRRAWGSMRAVAVLLYLVPTHAGSCLCGWASSSTCLSAQSDGSRCFNECCAGLNSARALSPRATEDISTAHHAGDDCWQHCSAGRCSFCGALVCCRAAFSMNAECGWGARGCQGKHCCTDANEVRRRRDLFACTRVVDPCQSPPLP